MEAGMPNLVRMKRTERYRGKYRSYPVLKALFWIAWAIGKVLSLTLLILCACIEETEKPRYRKFTY